MSTTLEAELELVKKERDQLAFDLGQEIAHRQRAEGLFQQASADRDRLKHDLEMETLARQDAERRFSESAMALSRAHAEIERLKGISDDDSAP